MKHTFTREFYLPKQYERIIQDGETLVYILSDTQAIGFGGKRAKFDWWYRFQTPALRDKYIEDYITGERQHQDRIHQERVKRSQPHTLNIGDILHGSWGYDQTNNDWFEVTALKGTRGVYVRPLAEDYHDTGFMCGNASPCPGHYIGPEQYHVVSADNTITYNPNEHFHGKGYNRDHHAWLWDGRPAYESSYA